LKQFLISLCIILLVASCSPAPQVGAGQYTPGAPLPTSAPIPTSTAMRNITPLPLALPTPEYPLRDGGTLTPLSEPITRDNLKRLIEAAAWGKGKIQELRWATDGSQIVVDTLVDFCVYDALTLRRTFAGPAVGTASNIYAAADEVDVQTGAFTLRLYTDGTQTDSFPVEGSGRGGPVVWVEYLPESRTIITAWTSGVRVYDAASHETLASFGGVEYRYNEKTDGSYSYQSDSYSAFDVSPDRRLIAAGRFDGQILLKSGADYSTTETLQTDGPVRFLAFSPDGSKLAAESGGTISIWDLTTGAVTGRLPDSFPAADFFYTPNLFGSDNGLGVVLHEQALLFANRGTVAQLDLLTGAQTTLLRAQEGSAADVQNDGRYDHPLYQPIQDLFLSADGKTLVTVMEDRTYTWEGPAFRFKQRLALQDEQDFGLPVAGVSTTEGVLLVGAQTGNFIRLYGIEDGKNIASIKAWNTGSLQYGYDGTHSLTVSPDGKYVFTWSGLEGTASLWEIQTQKRIMALKIPASQYSRYQPGFYPVALSPDTSKLVFTYNLSPQAHKATVYSIPDGKPLYEITAYHAAFSPDGSLIAASVGENRIALYDAATGEQLGSLSGTHANFAGLQLLYFTADGTGLTAISSNGTVSVWGLPQ